MSTTLYEFILLIVLIIIRQDSSPRHNITTVPYNHLAISLTFTSWTSWFQWEINKLNLHRKSIVGLLYINTTYVLLQDVSNLESNQNNSSYYMLDSKRFSQSAFITNKQGKAAPEISSWPLRHWLCSAQTRILTTNLTNHRLCLCSPLHASLTLIPMTNVGKIKCHCKPLHCRLLTLLPLQSLYIAIHNRKQTDDNSKLFLLASSLRSLFLHYAS